MDVFAEQLNERERGGASARDREKSSEAWLLTGKSEAERLLGYDKWLRVQLENRLEWSWAGAQKAKRIEQCRGLVEKMVLDLWKRGWLLDGRRLAMRITTMLDTVGKYQRAGKVGSFWPYFSATVNRYVGLNSEELQAEATTAGARLGHDLLKTLGLVRGADAKGPALPELVATRADEVAKAKAETLREKLSRERARSKASGATLPGL